MTWLTVLCELCLYSEPLDRPENFDLDNSTLTSTDADFTWDPVDQSVERVRGLFRGYQVLSWRLMTEATRYIFSLSLWSLTAVVCWILFHHAACNAMHGIAVGILSFCPSVCTSVRCMYCDKTKWCTADIFIPQKTAITLVFWH